MSQGMALGITVGTSNTVAVTTSGGQRRLHIRPSMLGTEHELPESFLSRVGDPVDIRMRDGSAVRAADLVAAAIGRAVDDSGRAAAMVACYPAWWSQHTVEVQRAALTAAGLDSVALVPEPAAAMRWLQEVHESSHDGAMIVYDLGATGLTVSVARTGALSGLLGEPVRSTAVAGAEFDLLTMRYVLGLAVGETDFNPFDPLVEKELAELRVRCKIAKESLSKQTATMIPVRLPGQDPIDVRLVRDEAEDLYRGPLVASIDLVHEALRRAGLTGADVDGILLTGGGASIPLVTELLSTEFGVPVAAAADPAHLSAHGAALLAADLLADTTDTEAHPAIAPLVRRGDNGGGGTRSPAAEHGNTQRDMATRLDDPRSMQIAAIGNRSGGAVEPVAAAHKSDGEVAGSTVAAAVPPLPDLPDEEPRTGFAHWRRVAVIGAVAIAVAALATGTLAMGTGAQSAPSNSPATSVIAPNPAAAPNPFAAPVNSDGQTAPVTHAGAPARAGAPGSAGTTAAAPNAAAPATPAAPGAPAAPAAAPEQPNSPAPQTVPAAPQPQLPTIPQPVISPPTVQLPDLGQLGKAVPTAPNIPHIGG
ncbi:MAG: Chaperone protein HscA like protein [Nocardia sp.]|uniref:Hsp70 family protein n=1 Tax=Nocardia sp. TaxID=1821 RepID=UPI0026087C9A|nr:Hsp70 family protein [Nocardia sp.]MCU1648158.1 Chaperone protein HscA like protein [Nocardia sp.]